MMNKFQYYFYMVVGYSLFLIGLFINVVLFGNAVIKKNYSTKKDTVSIER